MKLSNKITKFQEGGAMAPPVEQGAPQGAPMAPEGGAPEGAAPEEQDPIAQLVQLAQEALQSQNCEAAMTVCDGLLQVLSQAQGGGGAPQEPQGAPVYRKGGVLVRRN